MREAPEFYGIRNTSMPMRDLWSRDMFPTAISIALANRFADRGTPLNYIVSDESNRCSVSSIRVKEVYGCGNDPIEDMFFDFNSVYDPYSELAVGVPESDLVLRDTRGRPLGRLEILTSVVPDTSTRDNPDELMGPEMTVRTPLLESCALSMASSLLLAEEALDMLESKIPEDLDWSDKSVIKEHSEQIVSNLDAVQRAFKEMQSPFMLQTVWKSEPDGPFMAENAMDSFVWSDFAFSRMFLDPTVKRTESRMRPMRAAIRLYRMITSILRGEKPNLDVIVAETDYGISGHKEFMVNGTLTNRYMACDRLTRPMASAMDVASLATQGFESMIVPERRLDSSIYQVVRATRG